MGQDLQSGKIPSEKQRRDNSKRSKGWEGARGLAAPACWLGELPTIRLLFPPTPPPPAMSVSPLQTHASGRASQPGSTESLALLCRERGSRCCSSLPVSSHP